MAAITHEEYQNLILSEEDPYEAAISQLPEEDRITFLTAQQKYRSMQKDFVEKLKATDQSLLQPFLRLEAAATERNTYRADAMYLKGIMEEHANLRFAGWVSP